MAFTHDVDPSGTPICSSETWAELFHATNEKENYMGYDPETSWSNGSARPAVNAFAGKPRHVVLGIGAGENMKLIRDVADTNLVARIFELGAPVPLNVAFFKPLPSIATWTPYATFGDIYNDALGVGTDWETATADLAELPQSDSQFIKELLSIIKQLKTFRYSENIKSGSNPPHGLFQIQKSAMVEVTTDDAFAAAVADGVRSAAPQQTVTRIGVTYSPDIYTDYAGLFLMLSKPDVGGPTSPAPTTMEGSFEYDSQRPPIGFTPINTTAHLRESDATEFASPAWIADEAVPLVSAAITSATTARSGSYDASAVVDFSAVSYFRVDMDDVNPFDPDPNESQVTWLFADGSIDFRYETTGWTYE